MYSKPPPLAGPGLIHEGMNLGCACNSNEDKEDVLRIVCSSHCGVTEQKNDFLKHPVRMYVNILTVFTLLSNTFISQLEENWPHILSDMPSFYVGRATYKAYFNKSLDIC
jgi:hypothetical protein